jgi:hypothetical protein
MLLGRGKSPEVYISHLIRSCRDARKKARPYKAEKIRQLVLLIHLQWEGVFVNRQFDFLLSIRV